METGQIEKKVTWLDEQRRKDLEALEQVTESIGRLEKETSSQEAKLKEFSSEVARLSALATRINQFDDALHKHRQEFSRHLDELEARRTERDKNLDEIRRSDLEDLSKSIQELAGRLDPVESLRSEMDVRRDEEIRLTRDIDGLKKKIEALGDRADDQLRAITSVEETRKLESRRVIDLQTETSGLREKIDQVHGSIDGVEDRVRRLETRLAELISAEGDRRDLMTSWVENQERRLVDFERGWKDWEGRFAAFEARATELDEKMRSYEETYRNIKQLRGELEEVIGRLDRRINEITEIQRLSEDRTKQELTTFKADDQKRWNNYKLSTDEQWRGHNREHESINEELVRLASELTESQTVLRDIREVSDQRLSEMLALLRDWAQEVEVRGKGR